MSTFLIKDYVVSRRRIGKGSFSTIYKAFNTTNNREYAIKEIIVDKKNIKSNVKREFLVLKKLDHPNIVKLHDLIIDTSYNNIYFVFDYFKNGDLAKFLDNKPLKEKFCKKYAKQLADGLKYLHENNILHRDLKPQNILLTDDMNIQIADFGFARKVEKGMLLNTLCGSPMYMAPEIINKQDYSIKSDLWSVGIIIYQMIFGRVPYNVNNFMQLIKKINSEPINYTHKNITLPIELKHLLENLLQTDVNKRITWDEFFYHTWFIKDELLNEENNLLNFSINQNPSIPKLNKIKHHIEENQFASFIHKSIKSVDDYSLKNYTKDSSCSFRNSSESDNINYGNNINHNDNIDVNSNINYSSSNKDDIEINFLDSLTESIEEYISCDSMNNSIEIEDEHHNNSDKRYEQNNFEFENNYDNDLSMSIKNTIHPYFTRSKARIENKMFKILTHLDEQYYLDDPQGNNFIEQLLDEDTRNQIIQRRKDIATYNPRASTMTCLEEYRSTFIGSHASSQNDPCLWISTRPNLIEDLFDAATTDHNKKRLSKTDQAKTEWLKDVKTLLHGIIDTKNSLIATYKNLSKEEKYLIYAEKQKFETYSQNLSTNTNRIDKSLEKILEPRKVRNGLSSLKAPQDKINWKNRAMVIGAILGFATMTVLTCGTGPAGMAILGAAGYATWQVVLMIAAGGGVGTLLGWGGNKMANAWSSKAKEALPKVEHEPPPSLEAELNKYSTQLL